MPLLDTLDASPIPINATCSSCRWWLHIGQAEGQCRRDTPVYVDGAPGWPVTSGTTDFCGEWSQRYEVAE